MNPVADVLVLFEMISHDSLGRPPEVGTSVISVIKFAIMSSGIVRLVKTTFLFVFAPRHLPPQQQET